MQDLHTLKICIKTEKFLDTDTSFNIQPYLEKPVPYMPVHEASRKKTLPKALRTQALIALTSDFGLVGLVQYAWKAKFDLVW